MSKPIQAKVRLQLAGGSATPAPPVGQVLGPQGINLMEFCKQFNALTATQKGTTIPVVVTIFKDKTFQIVLKTPLTAQLLKAYAKVTKGAATHKAPIGSVTLDDVYKIAEIKMPDLNARDKESAIKTVTGVARSMGIEVK